MSQNSQERRRETRVEANFPMRLGPDGTIPGKLKNISRSGLCCVVPQPMTEMSLAKTSLELPDANGETRKVNLEGAVVRCEPEPDGGYEVAIFFQFPPPEAQEMISRIVNQAS